MRTSKRRRPEGASRSCDVSSSFAAPAAALEWGAALLTPDGCCPAQPLLNEVCCAGAPTSEPVFIYHHVPEQHRLEQQQHRVQLLLARAYIASSCSSPVTGCSGRHFFYVAKGQVGGAQSAWTVVTLHDSCKRLFR